jgi:hypothetical protein
MGRIVVAVLCVLSAAAQAAQPGALALLVTRAGESESRLVFVDPSTGKLPDGGARIAHLPGAAVRGALLPGRGAVVVADRAPGADRSWGASLLRVDGDSVVELCDRVDHASRPLVTADGRVVVARGKVGSIARPGELRTDELTVEQIDPTSGPASGAARVLWRGRGYQAHLAGSWNGEVVIYHVRAGGASLEAIPLDGGRARTLVASLPPYARDFSVDAGELAFAGRDEERSDRWVVDVVELASGARRRVHSSSSQVLAPRFWPGHTLAIAGEARGLELLGVGPRLPVSGGVVVVRATGSSGAAAWLHLPGRALPDVLLLDGDGRLRTRVEAPPRTHLEIVGFVGGAW